MTKKFLLHKKTKIILSSAVAILFIFDVYIFLALKIMNIKFPAYDKNGNEEFSISYKWAKSQRIPGPLSIYGRKTTIWNYVFFPYEIYLINN